MWWLPFIAFVVIPTSVYALWKLYKKVSRAKDTTSKDKEKAITLVAQKRSFSWLLWLVGIAAVVLLGIWGYQIVIQMQKPDRRPSITTRLRPGSVPTTPAEYEDLISGVSQKYGVDANLIKAVIQQESGWDKNAVGTSGEKGLMQLMPETVRRYSVSDPFDPSQNIDAGTHYLHDLLVRYNVDVQKSLAAYNSGEDNVDKGIIPLSTRNKYVPAVLGLWEQYRGGAPIPVFTGSSGVILAFAATPGRVVTTTTEIIAVPNQWSENISIPSDVAVVVRIEPKGKVRYRFWDGREVDDWPGRDHWQNDCVRNGNFRVLSRESGDVKVIVNVAPV